MIKIYFNNELKEVPIGTMVIDLIEDNKKTDYMVCQIGSQIKELRHTLTEKNNNMPVIPIGINHIEAGKAYEATLRYVIAMAFHNLYPEVDIRFSYNVSRSIFCQIITPNFHLSRATDKIIDEVARIVKKNLPIERINVTIDEAKEIYKNIII